MIGVVVTNFNRRVHLFQCLKAVTQQSYCSTDVVVADDGSTDGSLELLEELGIKYWTEESPEEWDDCRGGRAINHAVPLLLPNVDKLCIIQADVVLDPRYLWWANRLVLPGRSVCGLGYHLTQAVVTDATIHSMYRGFEGGKLNLGIARLGVYLSGGGPARTLIEMPDWRTVDGVDMCIQRTDMIPFYEEKSGVGGHWLPEWGLRLRMRGVRFYSSPLMQYFHQWHEPSDSSPFMQKGLDNMKRMYGPEIWHVASRTDSFFSTKTGLSGPLTRTVLDFLAHAEGEDE